jgi:hypothetical protein
MKRKCLCIRCGLKYPHEKVFPAHDKTCFKYSNLGHCQSFCANKRQKSEQQRPGRQLGHQTTLIKYYKLSKNSKQTRMNTTKQVRVRVGAFKRNHRKMTTFAGHASKLPICGETIKFLIDTCCPKFNVIVEHTYFSINVDRRAILNRN